MLIAAIVGVGESGSNTTLGAAGYCAMERRLLCGLELAATPSSSVAVDGAEFIAG